MELQLTPIQESPRRTLSNLVMDVVAPPPSAVASAENGSEPVALAPPEEAKPHLQEPPSGETPAKPKPTNSISPKQPGNEVKTAITATVIIVLSLSILAVVAFLKQK